MNKSKSDIFKSTQQKIEDQDFTIIDKDEERPWGGFFVIDEDQAPEFAETYFDDDPLERLNTAGKLSPKILLVQPEKRLSWQYHHRRAEIWKIVKGPVGIITSETDEQGEVKTYYANEAIHLQEGERHRLVGLSDWAVIAEIWQHTDPDRPSNEEDIVRVQDDFGR